MVRIDMLLATKHQVVVLRVTLLEVTPPLLFSLLPYF